MSTNDLCQSCRFSPVCIIMSLRSRHYGKISFPVPECEYWQDGHGNRISTPVREEEEPKKKQEDEDSISEAFANMLKPDETPVVPSDDEPKYHCSRCHKLVPESTLTETLHHEVLCEECYNSDSADTMTSVSQAAKGWDTAVELQKLQAQFPSVDLSPKE